MMLPAFCKRVTTDIKERTEIINRDEIFHYLHIILLILMKKIEYLLYAMRERYFHTWKVEPLFFNAIVLYV
jgi:hypothetical protein